VTKYESIYTVSQKSLDTGASSVKGFLRLSVYKITVQFKCKIQGMDKIMETPDNIGIIIII
jgi:hypothetical protein